MELLHSVDLMLDYLAKPIKHESFFKKYAAKKYMKASIFVRDWVARRYARNA